MKPLPFAVAMMMLTVSSGYTLAQYSGAQVSAEVIFESTTDILGSPIAYPAGTPKVTAVVVTLPVGAETGWHVHSAPMYARMLEGTLTVDYGSKGKKTYQPGESLVEAINWPHNGSNAGTVPVRILSVYATADGVANATTAPGGQ